MADDKKPVGRSTPGHGRRFLWTDGDVVITPPGAKPRGERFVSREGDVVFVEPGKPPDRKKPRGGAPSDS
ncbi:MAG: hypothetical protein ACTHMY_17985 [Solirubrobacteraceae bacterium]